MGEVVNLRRVRKAKARADKAAEAGVNRLAHGRPKTEREAEAARDRLAARRLDGHRLEEPDDGG